MTHRRLLSSACTALALLLLHGAPMQAQQTTPPPTADRRAPAGPGAQDGPGRRGPASIDDRVTRMTAELGLNADQATKVRGALTAEQRTTDSVLARRVTAQDAERAAMAAMHANMQKSLAGILTPDQKIKHDAMRARHGGRGGPDHAGRGGQRGGRDRVRDARRNDRRDDRRGPPRDDARSR